MKIKLKKKFRKYKVGNITINDCGNIFLKNNEQLTFIHNKSQEYDVCKKSWGFYATPSINYRLKKNNFSTFIIINKEKRFGIHIVDNKKKKYHKKYLKSQSLKIISWPKNLKQYL
jgi:hypothetical protein